MTPYKEVFWQQWGEKTQINRKKSLAEPGSGRGGHLPRLVGSERRKTGQRHTVEKNTRLIITNDKLQNSV